MEESKKKRYWMKFQDRFFDKHEIKILLMEDRDYVFFYIAMLLESISHVGYVRYNEKKPYTPKILAMLLNMPVDKVTKSIEALKDADLLEVLEDGTIYLPAAAKMCGAPDDSTPRVAKFRAKKKAECNVDVTQCNGDVTVCNGVTSESNECVTGKKRRETGNIEYRDKSIEIRDKKEEESISPKPSPEKEEHPESVPVTREYVHQFFERMRSLGGKKIDESVEDEFWQFLVDGDFKKGNSDVIITKLNMASTYRTWITNKRKERSKEEEAARKQAEEQAAADRWADHLDKRGEYDE